MATKTLFAIKNVFKLRQRAQEANDPMALLAVFTSLHIKKGFTLRAFEHHGCCEGLGNVWAVPVSSPLPAPEEYEMVHWSKVPCPFLICEGCGDINEEAETLKLPRPPDALGNVMEAIDGDGTPWSYLSASICAREIAEFGARWPGEIWSTHRILGGDPWTFPHVWQEEDKEGPSSEQGWQWLGRRPSEWKPSVVCNDEVTLVKFFTYSMLVQEAIYRFTDIYKHSSYEFQWDAEVIAKGQAGIIF